MKTTVLAMGLITIALGVGNSMQINAASSDSVLQQQELVYRIDPVNQDMSQEARILSALQEAIDFSFSQAKPGVFNWYIPDGSSLAATDLSGMSMSAFDVHSHSSEVQQFFWAHGFDIDVTNVSAGVIGAATGYRKGNIVCLQSERFASGAELITESHPELLASWERELVVSCSTLAD